MIVTGLVQFGEIFNHAVNQRHGLYPGLRFLRVQQQTVMRTRARVHYCYTGLRWQRIVPGLLHHADDITKEGRFRYFIRMYSVEFSVAQVCQFSGRRYAQPGFVEKTKKMPHVANPDTCLLYTSPSPRDGLLSRMPSSA